MKEMPTFRGAGKLSFRPWLERLKLEGSNILVTGDVPAEISAQASRVLFSQDDEKHRYRILGLIGRESMDPDERLPEHVAVEDSETWIIDQCASQRSAPKAATDLTSDLEPLSTGDIRELCIEAQTAISFYERQSDGLEPAEMRVGVDSLDVPVEDDLAETKTSLRMLAAAVRGVSGMAHYHIRSPHDSEIVEELMPIFDARIELRKRAKLNPEQRWYSPEMDLKTDWVEL